MIAHILNIAVGLTFSGGLLDLFIFGVLQGNAKTSWMRIIPVGVIYFLLYYFIFSFLIKKFDLKTMMRRQSCIQRRMSMHREMAEIPEVMQVFPADQMQMEIRMRRA